MQLKGRIAVFAAALMLGGCAFGLGGGSPPATFDLEAPAVAKVRGVRPVQLAINPPVAVKTIDTEEILVKGANGRVAYFTGVAWGDRLPRLFQARLVEALANSGAFKAILTNQDRVQGDMSLGIEIRDFQVETSAAGAEAVVDVYVKLIDERNNAVVTTKRFQARAPAAGNDPGAGIQALNGAFREVAAAIVAWVSHRVS
ncbi:MAG: ABC-type transport auxiliary lipoprotein family protein [Rhodomicrobium sp.]|jgi:cholesterol transport system auxiliary component